MMGVGNRRSVVEEVYHVDFLQTPVCGLLVISQMRYSEWRKKRGMWPGRIRKILCIAQFNKKSPVAWRNRVMAPFRSALGEYERSVSGNAVHSGHEEMGYVCLR